MTTSLRSSDAEIPLPRLRTISHLWSCAAVLASTGVAALAIDVPLSNWIQQGRCPDFVRTLCDLSEVFGHGMGVALIVLLIGVLDPWHRYAIPRIAAAALGSGLLADVIKLVVARTRPHHFDLDSRGLESFGQWFPFFGSQSWEHSFPSAHTATAAGLAIVLSCFYPRGRWLFPAFAALVGMQRLINQMHFLSDVFWGAAMGCISPLCVYGSRLARGFDRLEEHTLARTGLTNIVRGPHRKPTKAPSKDSTNDVPRAA